MEEEKIYINLIRSIKQLEKIKDLMEYDYNINHITTQIYL